MSSNYQVNKEAVEQFRKELKAMLSDVGKLDKQILNQAVNEGTAYAKRHTPVGKHPNPITFVVRNGPKAGTKVSFTVNDPGVGGFLRKSWSKLPAKRTGTGIEVELVNRAEYASFWNDGHRIVTKRGGPTKGFVKGAYVLERAEEYVWTRLKVLFEKKIKEIQEKYDQ